MTIKLDENAVIIINDFYSAIIIGGKEFGMSDYRKKATR